MRQPKVFSAYLEKRRKRKEDSSSQSRNDENHLEEEKEEEEEVKEIFRRQRSRKDISLVSFKPIIVNSSNKNSVRSTVGKTIMTAISGGIMTAKSSSGSMHEAPAPRPRSGHRMCADDNFLYLFGGYNPSFKTFSELWRFNTTTERWSLMPDEEQHAPNASASSSMVLAGRNLFVFGGTGYPFAASNSNALFMYSLKIKRWFNLTQLDDTDDTDSSTSDLLAERQGFSKYPKDFVKKKGCGCQRYYDSVPSPKYGHGMALVDHKIFIHSGTQGEIFFDELHSFSLKTFRWSSYHLCGVHSKYAPKARYRHELVALGNRLHVIGGATIESTISFDRMETFHLDTKSWSYNSTLQCIQNNSYGQQQQQLQLEQVLETIPVGRKAHTCVVFKDEIYVCGGYNCEEGILDDFWSFDTLNGKWKQYKEVTRLYK